MPLQTMSYWYARISSGSIGLQRLQLALRHREGVVAEIDLLGVLVIFEHREIDDPAEFEAASWSISSKAVRRRGCAPGRPAWRPELPCRRRRRCRRSGPRPMRLRNLRFMPSWPWLLAIGPAEHAVLAGWHSRDPGKPSLWAQLFMSSKNLRLFSCVFPAPGPRGRRRRPRRSRRSGRSPSP